MKAQIVNIVNGNQPKVAQNTDEWLELKEKGNQFFKTGNFTEALIHYSKAIKLDNKQGALYLNRALCELKLDRLEYARQDAEDAMDLDPNNVKAHRVLSEILMKLERVKVFSKKKYFFETDFVA